MYYNGFILKKNIDTKEERLEKACEATATTITHKFKPEYTLRDKYFPIIADALPKTETILFKHIAKYEDKYSEILNSPYPTDILPFGEQGEDANVIFRCCNIDPDKLKADMKKVPLPPYIKEKAAFQPLQVVLYFIIRYYLWKKEMTKVEIIYNYYGYSLYWKRFHKSFRYGLNSDIMIYTINEMTYRNLIKKLGSVKKLVGYITKGRIEYYREQVADSCDEDIRYILDQIQSDFGSKINEIASKYYANSEKKNIILMSKTMVDSEGTQRESSSITSSVQSLSQKYSSDFFMTEVDNIKIKTASNLAKDVSMKEVRNTMEYIMNNATIDEIEEFYAAMFYIYLTLDDPRVNADSINSILFLTLMRDLLKKGNSNNKNIKRIRELLDDWLSHGSNTFRVTNRDGTKTAYRKAVYFYFILTVTSHK